MPIFNGGRIGSNNVPFTGTKSDDPNYSSVSLLLNGNGTNGSTTFTDSSSNSHTVTPVGNAQISTTQSKFGGASMYFDGGGDYLQSPTSTDFILGTNDFTLEAWIYPLGFAGAPNYNNYGAIFDYRTANASQVNVLLSFLGNSTLVLYVNGSTRITGSAISTNQWTHVALTRSSGVTKMFINGIQSGSSYSDTNSYVSSVFRIGGNIAGNAFFNGYIDDLRITKGVARYTSNFTPPTAQLPGAETGTFASGLWTGLEQCDAIRREIWPGFVPPIVTDGLVLHLDAGDSASYPGSGTTWTDLSGNGNHFSWSSPAPTYTTYNNTPVISTTNTYTSLRAVRSNTYNGMRTGTGPYTVFSFFRPNQTTSTKVLISFGPANNNCSGQNIHPIGIGPNGKFVGGSCGGLGTWSSSAGVTPTTGRFWNVCTTYDGTTERVYVDGVLDKSASSFTNNTPVSTSNAISLGWIRDDGASYSMDASIGIILIYNKALTQSEITQNYNVLKGRYGL